MPRTHTIYAIEHISTGKVYVGRSGYVHSRRNSHLNQPAQNTVIGREIKRLGKDQFSFRILDTAATILEAGKRERFWVHLLESNDPRFGYNNPHIYALEPLPTINRLMLPIHGMSKTVERLTTCRHICTAACCV